MRLYAVTGLVLCESPDGWSLHPPGSTDEQIATGEPAALYIISGPGRPTGADYARAYELWQAGCRLVMCED